MVFSCRLYNVQTGEWIDYTEAFEIKIDGIYGYLCVDLKSVKFFWGDDDGQRCNVTDYTHRFVVHYNLAMAII